MVLYGVDTKVYRYLTLMHPKGWKDPTPLMNDSTRSDSYREKIQKMKFNKTEIDGVTVDLTEMGILAYILSTKKKDITMSELVRQYKMFTKKQEITTKNISSITITRVKSIAESEDNPVLKTSSNTVKYFPYGKNEVESLFARLELDRYKDMYVAAELLRKDHPDLMTEFGLKNEIEVYQLFAKYRNSKILKSFNIVLPAQPSIKFGNGNMDNQLIALLKETGRISKNDFCKLYSQLYGTKEMSVRVHMSSYPQYSNNDYFEIDLPELPEDVVEYLRPRLKSAVIPHSEARQHFLIAERKYGISSENSTDLYYNIRNISKFGYSMSQGALFLDVYDNIQDCIEKEYLDKDYVTVDREMGDISAFTRIFDSYVKRGEYYLVAPNEYIKASKLHSAGVTDDMIRDYISSASTYLPDGTYFTLDYLHNQGFEHPLEDQGFDNDFYEALISRSPQISKSDINRCKVFVSGTNYKRDAAIIQMITTALDEDDSGYAYDLSIKIQQDYGIDVGSELKKDHKPLRYNSETEKIYRDETVYIEELLGN